MRRSFDLWRFPGTRSIAYGVLVFLYVPIAVLVALSFSAGDSISQWAGFTTHWYAAVWADEDMLRAIRNSLVVATAATFVGTTMATLAALCFARDKFSGKGSLEAVLGLPLIVPDVVAGIAILLFFALIGLPLGVDSIILAHCVFAIPFAYFPIRARLSGLDPSLGEAAADLYAPPWRAFRRITLPLIWPGIAAGAMLAFVSSLGDVVVAYFVSGPGGTTLPVYIFSMIRMGFTPVVNAVSTLLALASILLLTLSYMLSRWSR